MRNTAITLAALAAVMASVGAGGDASAQALRLPPGAMGEGAAPAASQPLVIIRFNQRTVYFQRQLYNAVSRAVAVKPSVRFDVVSLVPTYGADRSDSRNARAAEANLAKVVRALNEMGVPSERLTVKSENSDAVESSEVHIFVR